MKNYFIINPKAGKGKHAEALSERIRSACERCGAEYDIYTTTEVGDATRFVREKCANADNLPARFFACGGDGTLGEVVNGAIGVDGAYVGLIPSGTGNDFVRNFSDKDIFFDIEAQLNGESVQIDVLKCNDVYAINMINIGFDCEVVKKKESIQARGILPAKLAYIFGLVATLARKPGVKAKISFDGGEPTEAKYLLTTYANGKFCGGGFHSNPLATLIDGECDVLLVNDISRTRFVSLVGSYKKGTHINPKTEKILSSRKAKSIDIEFFGTQSISIDGELFDFERITISCVRDALRFTVPRGVALPDYFAQSAQRESVTV